MMPGRFSFALSIALACSIPFDRAAAAAPRHDDTAGVLAYERAVCAAYQRNDAAAIDSLVADDYVLTESNGSFTRKADDIRDARNETVTFTAFRNEDMKVTMYGSTAIVRGKTIVQGTSKDGSKVDIVVQFTDTVVKIDDKWKLVAGHVSRLKNS